MKRKILNLYNTESREMEEILPLDGRTIRIYTCGPTVYNYAHIGNFRTYIFEDLLRRTLKFFGFTLCQVMNLTDVDDKTIRGAIEKGVSLPEFTQPFKEAFFEDLKVLNIEKAEHYPQATDYIPQMIEMIQSLLDKKFAYVGLDKSVYFAIRQFPGYGRLSHLDLEELEVGASDRVAVDEYDKESASDFVLWKAHDSSRDGEIFWESPFGKGRPGWHIECSAMATSLLGPSIDIHAGGVDNIFPHHENEIAQSEGHSCCRFVKHWVHSEHLLVDHKKMSKSLGNFYTLRDLLQKGYLGEEIRYELLRVHYRTQLNFTFAGLDGAKATLQRLFDFISRLKAIRHEKMHKALDLILEKALPEIPQKKEIRERILFDVTSKKGRDILDPAILSPIVERSIGQILEKGALLQRILTQTKEEKDRSLLHAILDKTLHHHPEVSTILSLVIHEVRDEKERDILDFEWMKPILQKAFAQVDTQTKGVEKVLLVLKEKKNHGYILPVLRKAMEEFSQHLADDLNISAALGALFEMVREVNGLCDKDQVGISEAEDVLDFLRKIDEVLGVLFTEKEEGIPQELLEILERREEARKKKDWALADECRSILFSEGYQIEDTPQGARLKKRV